MKLIFPLALVILLGLSIDLVYEEMKSAFINKPKYLNFQIIGLLISNLMIMGTLVLEKSKKTCYLIILLLFISFFLWFPFCIMNSKLKNIEQSSIYNKATKRERCLAFISLKFAVEVFKSDAGHRPRDSGKQTATYPAYEFDAALGASLNRKSSRR